MINKILNIEFEAFLFCHDEDSCTLKINNELNLNVQIHCGKGIESYSKLINSCIEKSKSEVIIIMSYKARPKKEDFIKTVKLLNQGYSIVGLYMFGFCGINKELFRKIGCFDERYVGGNFEDSDFITRMNEANIGYYLTKEIEYEHRCSLWGANAENNKQFYIKKWGTIHIAKAKRQLEEPIFNYDLGKSSNCVFLDSTHSICA